jgi:hypothetical protein
MVRRRSDVDGTSLARLYRSAHAHPHGAPRWR